MAAGTVVATPAAQAVGPTPHYLMTAFTNSSESNMYVYDSADATTFNQVKANSYTPPSGLIRDPSVIKHTDGYYYVVYTTGWTGNTIGFARSMDHTNWTFLCNVTVGLNGSTGSTWAPEWFKDSDGSVHVIFSASTTGIDGQFRPYRITATKSDLSAWTSPTTLGIPAKYIDSFVVKVGGTYHNFIKNETTRYIEHATATSLNGPWTFVGTGDWAKWGSWVEGPAVVHLPDGRLRPVHRAPLLLLRQLGPDLVRRNGGAAGPVGNGAALHGATRGRRRQRRGADRHPVAALGELPRPLRAAP